jgi:hypothetical protein
LGSRLGGGAPIPPSIVPTHRDKPDGFEEEARRRSQAVDEANERARSKRAVDWRGNVQEKEEARKATSVPPPPPRP